MMTQSNGRDVDAGSAGSASAQEVREYTLKTLDLITQWISSGETSQDEPACKWENSAHLRRSVEQRDQQVLQPGPKRAIDDETLFNTVLRQTLQDGVNPWTHRFLDKLYTTPTTLSPALELLLGAMNASGVVSSASPSLSLAEEYTVEAFARLLHWDESKIDGLTMPGGSSSNVLAVQTALGNAFPSFKQDGIPGVVEDLMTIHGRRGRAARPILLTSDQSHYSLEKAALACGMGLSSIVRIRCDRYGRMDLVHLREVLTQSDAGYPFFINATSGTTILGAFDDLQGIVDVVDDVTSSSDSALLQRRPWIHCDASWGGSVLFSTAHRHLMRGIEHVDSLTINPHKLLNITQQCSFALFRIGTTLAVNVTGAKYLFHSGSADNDDSDARAALRLNPGSKTMGCGRRPDAFKFYIEWLRVGTQGFGQHVDRAIEYAQTVTQWISESSVLQLAEAVPTGSQQSLLYCQVNFRPRLPAEASQWLQEDAHAQDLLLSSATHWIHAALRRIGKYTIDKAPLVYPHPHVGYFTRLVTHPNTSLEVYKDIVAQMESLAQEWWSAINRAGHEEMHKRIEAERQRV